MLVLLCSEAAYGALLAPYLDDPSNLFVISSDFCHWGMRFNYTHYKQSAVRAGPAGWKSRRVAGGHGESW